MGLPFLCDSALLWMVSVNCSLDPELSFVPDHLPSGTQLLQTPSQVLAQFADLMSAD